MIVGSPDRDCSEDGPIGTTPVPNIRAAVPLCIDDLLASISGALHGHEFLKSRSPDLHHQGNELPFHLPDLHPLCLTTHKGKNLIDRRGHVGYWSFHLRSSSRIHRSANAMYPIRGPESRSFTLLSARNNSTDH